MSDTKHTPGPWFTCDYETGEPTKGGLMVAAGLELHDGPTICGCEPLSDGQDKANARLIAAAPDMLKALELVNSKLCGCHDTSDENWHSDRCFIPAVRVAIKKANSQ